MTQTPDTAPAQTSRPAPEDGAGLLDHVHASLTRYVVLPSPEAAWGVVLWIAATHVQPAWAHAPRLVIRAPEKQCGKSRLLDLVEALSFEPLITVNASPAAVYRSIGTDDPPTILVDESDTIFGGKAGEANEDLRGLLNAGHQRNRPTIRYNAATNKVEKIPTFAMAALAGIGAMPDTIEDRAVVIHMRRRAPGEHVDPYRYARDGLPLRAVRHRLTKWARAHLDAFRLAAPDLPVEDRAADTWEPLVVLADAAGGEWPERARNAAVVLTSNRDAASEPNHRIRLLMDCRTAFGTALGLPTATLLDRLRNNPESPWSEYGVHGLSPMKLGQMLREYGIRSVTARFDGVQAKGYTREAFADAWTRYLTDDAGQVAQATETAPIASTFDLDVEGGG